MAFPVFVINGFLDSGKSTFINDTLINDDFYKRGTTLLLVCEEGEIEFDEAQLNKFNVIVQKFDDVSEFTVDKLYDLTEKYKPGRIVLEVNTMWDQASMNFPSTFQVAQIVSFIDFTTFGVYFNNMRQKFVDNLRFSDLIVINRCDDVQELAKYQTSLKMINNNAQWIAMNSKGEVCEAFETPLPFDITKDVIKIKDPDFARWYIDTFDHPERYNEKKVEFNALVFKSRKLPKGSMVVGRHVMTCCAKDIQLYGHLCKSQLDLKLKSKSWVKITAVVKYEYSEEYEENELVLYPISLKPIKKIKDDVLNLV